MAYPSFNFLKIVLIVDIPGLSLSIGITHNLFKIAANILLSNNSFFPIVAIFLFFIAAATKIGSKLDL